MQKCNFDNNIFIQLLIAKILVCLRSQFNSSEPIRVAHEFQLEIFPLRERCATFQSESSEGKLWQVNWSPLFHLQSCDDQFLFFTDTINEIIETSLSLRRVKTDCSDKPWITPEIKTLIAKRQRAWSRGNDFTFKRYRNMVNAQYKKARNSYYNKI